MVWGLITSADRSERIHYVGTNAKIEIMPIRGKRRRSWKEADCENKVVYIGSIDVALYLYSQAEVNTLIAELPVSRSLSGNGSIQTFRVDSLLVSDITNHFLPLFVCLSVNYLVGLFILLLGEKWHYRFICWIYICIAQYINAPNKFYIHM